jgi:tetratricopeptide (TPR) repeat protein
MPEKLETSRPGAGRTFLICLGLVLATVAVYWRVGGFGFLDYDDTYIFFKNSFVRGGLAWDSIVWGATTCFYEYWHPLMWWSHELDCQLFGLNAGPHHLVSLGFHVINTLLVFAIFRRMTGMVWRSAIVAALFALHPLHVESVAWLAERKDVLSAMFWLLSVWAYVRYVEESKVPSPKSQVEGARRATRFYWLALVFFLLGLLSKPMVITLPFVLLLLDYWPLNRMAECGVRSAELKVENKSEGLAGLVLEKWPFFGLTALFCFITWYSVKIGNNFPAQHLASPEVRWANIPISYVRYLWKTIYPHDLAVLYPMPAQWPWWQVAGAILLLAAITWLVLRAQSARYLFFGWFAFIGILVPTIGVVQVGEQAMADRYMYLPLLGVFASAVWGAEDLFGRWKAGRLAGGILTILLLGGCGWLSWVQVQYWQDSVSLWTHCLATGAESATAHHDLGQALVAVGESQKAVEQYKAALKLDPNDRVANLSYGAALILMGKPREATNYFAKVLQAEPDYGEAHENMGHALMALGDLDGAVSHFGEAIRLNPTRAVAYVDMGGALSAQGKSDEAMNYYLTALNLNPALAAAHYYLGLEYLKRGAIDDAVRSLESAERFDPATLGTHLQLADIYSRQHEPARVIAEYRAALRLNPNLPGTLNNLAWLLATNPDARLRDGAEAVKLAEQACEATGWQQTITIGTLAAAYAEAGDFDKAVQTAQKACDTASAHGEKELLGKNQELLADYKNHQAFRDQN